MAEILTTEELFKDNKIVSTEELFGKEIISSEELFGKERQLSPEDLAKITESSLIQGVRGMMQQIPFGRRYASLLTGKSLEKIDKALQALPQAKKLPGKLGAGVGSLIGMYPSFAAGGLGGGAVAKGIARKLAVKLPRLAKYIGAGVGGATTFTGARALRNIGQNQPITQGLPEEAAMGAVYGPTGLIRSYPKAIATSAGLGAMLAPEGEKLSTAILFGGLTALTHQLPDLSAQDKADIDILYKEATFKEGIRAIQKGITQRQLPAPTTIYGEGFTATPAISRIPLSIQKQLQFRQPKALEYQPTLEKGAIKQGRGFTVVGGKQIARPLAKAVAQELRTTPTPEETIQTVAQQVPSIKEKIRTVDGIVVTPKDLEPISKPVISEIKPSSIKTPQIDILQTPTKFYAKIKAGEIWQVSTGATSPSGTIITKRMTSEKAMDIIKKSLKKYSISGEGEYIVIDGEGGFVDLRLLSPLAETIRETATKIYRGLSPAGEVLRNDKLINSIMQERQRKMAEVQSGELPQSMIARRLREINDSEKAIQIINQSGSKDESIMVTRTANAIDKERAFVNKYTKIIELADKIGIAEGSKASEVIFKALDYRRALPEEIAKLTPNQQKFIPIIRNAYKEIWKTTGKPEYEGIRDYATHLINDGLEKGYDVSSLGRFLPDELYSRFFEHRKGAKPYQQDIIKAMDVYIPSVARKIFREPALGEFNKLEPYLGVDFKNEAVDFMEAFLGRGRYKGEEVLGNLPKGLVRLTYRGTLYGNFSAATKNATQVLTNTIPEIGIKSVLYGYRRLMNREGRQEFVNSQLAGDFTLGKPINQLDFFSQVEFVNRGVSYLGAKHKALSEGKGLIEAENYAKKIVRKTQFIQTGIDIPKLYRQYGAAGRILGQFTQFPTKQGFLLYNWARNREWGKVARFATIAYLLGGTRTVPFLDGIINNDYKHLPQIPDDMKKSIRNVERYTSLAGLSGMDIGQNFGLGIYSSGVPFARGPAASLIGAEIPRFVKGIATREITNLQDIIRSRLVQKSLPTLIPGGVAMKKVIDLINADENDYKIRNAYNQLQYTSSPKEEILRILVGPTKERKEAWQSLSKEKQEAEIYRNEHRKMLDYLLDSNGDTMGLEEFIKRYPNYDISNLVGELMGRAKNREIPANIREYLRRPKALR